MAGRPETVVDKLAIIVKSLNDANEALRQVIEEETSHLDQFEKYKHRFLDTRKEVNQKFKDQVNNLFAKGEEAKLRLYQEIELKRKQVDSLKIQVQQLVGEVEDLTKSNKELERKTTSSAKKLHDLKRIDDQSFRLKPKSPQIFIRRLQNELD